MNDVVEINQQEAYVWLACEDGWNRCAGFIGKIYDIDCSFVLVPNNPVCILVSELRSGAGIKTIPISIIDVVLSDTKEKTIALLKEKAIKAAKVIKHNGADEVHERAYKRRIYMESNFGPMPEIEKLDMEDDQ